MDTSQQQTAEPEKTTVAQAVTVAVNQAMGEFYMMQRASLLGELAYLEERLIRLGALRYRTKPPSHRRDED